MTHAGDARHPVPGGPPPIPGVMTFGAATAGEVLVDRYRLEQHVESDTAGRQIWRGVDMVLRRPVALVIRQPGGDAAAGMLTAAVAASRLVHPHLVAVYDAIDEGHRAYVVREWVPGIALRDLLLREGPLDAQRATLVTHAVSEAVAALHVAGIVHGNIHPGTILIADDGRVVLLDAHADAPSNPELDVRAVGAVLYACLTGHWPWAEAGRSTLPDVPRDGARRPVRPRQVRGGVPRHLDEIAVELLDPQVAPPPAGTLAAEFAQLVAAGTEEEYPVEDYGGYDDRGAAGPMGFREDGGGGRRFSTVKIIAGIAILAIIAVVGVFVVMKVLPSSPEAGPSGPAQPAVTTPPPSPTVLTLTAAQVRMVDPPPGTRTESRGIENVVDGDLTTGWRTDRYYGNPAFGLLKPGMGILIDLGAPTKVTAVRVVTAQQGATISLRTGPSDPGNTAEGDQQIAQNWTTIGSPVDNAGTTTVFTLPECLREVPVGSPCPEADQKVQFLAVWITVLPPDTPEGYRVTVNEIEVLSIP